jgi:hypothetical protein
MKKKIVPNQNSSNLATAKIGMSATEMSKKWSVAINNYFASRVSPVIAATARVTR